MPVSDQPDPVLFFEEADDFRSLNQAFNAEHRPSGITEEALVRHIVLAVWRLRRLARAETGVLDYESRKAAEYLSGDGRRAPAADRHTAALGLAFIRDCAGANAGPKLARCAAQTERAFTRAVEMLERLQQRRNAGRPAKSGKTRSERK